VAQNQNDLGRAKTDMKKLGEFQLAQAQRRRERLHDLIDTILAVLVFAAMAFVLIGHIFGL